MSSDEGIGTLAENLLEALREHPDVNKKIDAARRETRAEKKRMAMAMRQKALGTLGMTVGPLPECPLCCPAVEGTATAQMSVCRGRAGVGEREREGWAQTGGTWVCWLVTFLNLRDSSQGCGCYCSAV